MWKYGTGEHDFSIGLCSDRVVNTLSIVQGSEIFGVNTMEGSRIRMNQYNGLENCWLDEVGCIPGFWPKLVASVLLSIALDDMLSMMW